MQVAAANGQVSTIDPTIPEVSLGGILLVHVGRHDYVQRSDPNIHGFNYTRRRRNSCGSIRRGDLDYNLNQSHRLLLYESISRDYISSYPDTLNNAEPRFPGFPNQGQEPSDRYSGLSGSAFDALAILSQRSSHRSFGRAFALQSGSQRRRLHRPGGQSGRLQCGAPGNNATGIAVFGINGPTPVNAPSRRNPLFRQFSDTLTWLKGSHSLAFGGSLAHSRFTPWP